MEWTKLWLQEPEEPDFPAVADYLSLLRTAGEAKRIVDGYQRGCAACHLTEDLVAPCRITGRQAARSVCAAA